MKYKDHIYDEDLKTACIWLEDVHPVQLENLLEIVGKEERKKRPKDSSDIMLEFLNQEGQLNG